jgi:hypothetical protein
VKCREKSPGTTDRAFRALARAVPRPSASGRKRCRREAPPEGRAPPEARPVRAYEKTGLLVSDSDASRNPARAEGALKGVFKLTGYQTPDRPRPPTRATDQVRTTATCSG